MSGRLGVLLAIAAGTTLAACPLAKQLGTNRASVTESAPSAPQLDDPGFVETERAIELAKEGRNLVAGHLYTKLPPRELLTNEFQIRTQMTQIKGEINIFGWKAEKWAEDTYLVTYTYERRGTLNGWPFEVNVSAGVVRYIIGDTELEKKYGWGSTR